MSCILKKIHNELYVFHSQTVDKQESAELQNVKAMFWQRLKWKNKGGGKDKEKVSSTDLAGKEKNQMREPEGTS